MFSQGLEHLRIVVRIHSLDDEENNNVKNSNDEQHNTPDKTKDGIGKGRSSLASNLSPPIPTSAGHMKAEVLYISETTLQLNTRETEAAPCTIISQKMTFDQVIKATDAELKIELDALINKMISERHNCCIMRFIPRHEIEVALFYDALVMYFDKRLQQEKFRLQHCKLQCMDITNLMLGKEKLPEEGFILRAALAPNKQSNANDGKKYLRNTRNKFRNSGDLLLWLLNEYRSKLNDINGHEKLILTLSIRDNKYKVFNVKLYLFNIYINMMDREERNHWHKYMEHIGEGCQGEVCEYIHSGLTVSLSNHIDGSASDYGLLLFDIPTGSAFTSETIDILQMAHSVVTNRLNIRRKRNLKNKQQKQRKTVSSFDPIAITAKVKKEIQSPVAATQNEKRKSVAFTVTTDDVNRCQKKSPSTEDILKFNESHFNSLSSWYRKMDDYFKKVCKLRESYYKCYFSEKSQSYTNGIKQLVNCIKPSQGSATSAFYNGQDSSELKEHYSRYCVAKNAFTSLTDNIETSIYKNTLHIYLKTKTYELQQHDINSKIEQLKDFQKQLSTNINNEIKSLYQQIDK